MALTVVGVFDNANEAQRAVETLVNEGFSRDSIDLSTAQQNDNSSSGDNSGGMQKTVSGDIISDRGSINNSGTMAEEVVDTTRDAGSGIGNFFSSLFGMDDDNTDRYSRVGERSSIVTVHATSNDEAERAADVLDECGAVDVNERDAQYAGSGMTGSGMTGSGVTNSGMTGSGMGMTDSTMNTNRTSDVGREGETMSVPVIEEKLNISKQNVETGGVRVRSQIVERPVEESVRLRTERVVVQRNPVDRAATDADFTSFKEGEMSMTEQSERAVVAKEARIVEEVTIGKTVDERDEVVHDTVRRTDVQVDQLNETTGTQRTNQSNLSDMTNDPRNI